MKICNLRTVKRTEIELSVYSRCDTVGKTITPATTKRLVNQKLTYSFVSILKLRAEFRRKFDLKPFSGCQKTLFNYSEQGHEMHF